MKSRCTYRVYCSKCNKDVMVTPEVYQRRIELHGSEEALTNNYLCQECSGGNPIRIPKNKAKGKFYMNGYGK